MSIEEQLLARFNRPAPTLQGISGIEEWNLTERQIERATEIVRTFTLWTDETGKCPISVMDNHWFKKLCALGEWIAILEGQIDPERYADIVEEDDGLGD